MHACIVSSKHVSYNPRVVKEADALSAAGHKVTVVTVCNNHDQALLDEGVMAMRTWQLLSVRCRKQGLVERLRWLRFALRQRLYASLQVHLTPSLGVAERAQCREYPELRSLARSVRADLYIAHHAEALGAAWSASCLHDGRFAFDAEDFHSQMFNAPAMSTTDEQENRSVRQLLAASEDQPKNAEQRRIEYLERKYLPRCDYITAASDGIGEAYASKYGLPRPTTLLNVFPLEANPEHLADHLDCGNSESKPAAPIRLYWYSQVIGPGRGLEDAVKALSLMRLPCELHLRGSAQADFVEKLLSLASRLDVLALVRFHPPCAPDSLIDAASCYDIGLALETGKELNNLLASSNKLFTYMNAGLAIVASDTPGQRGIMNQATAAGLLCRMNDAVSLAEAINRLLEEPQALRRAQRASRAAAETRFNWELESKKLLELACAGY